MRLTEQIKDAIITHYKSYDHPRWHLKAKERKLLKDRLEDGYTVEELKMAIDGLHLTDWNMGKNPGGTEYLGIYYAFHEDKIDGRISTAEKHAKEMERERSVKEKLDREHSERVKANQDRVEAGENSTKLYREALRKSSDTMN
tara:strand:+ start:86 stop:514 length:429 start_codon:yes stop_codon:yes gene_type:complete